jgi:putative MATE family efflux protein
MENARKAVLIQGAVGRTLVNLTWPMVFGILGMVTFNLVDTFFVGRLGIRELAALSFTFPVIMAVSSLALGLGIGTASLVSRAIGEGDERQVKRLTTDSLILSTLIVVTFVVAGQLTIKPLFRALGAAPDIVPLILRYMRIWLWGMIFVVVPMVGNSAIRATGDTRTPSAIMLVAVSINLVLDPLLIFGWGPFPRMELAGAALTTVFARATVFFVSLYILIRRDRMLTARLFPFREIVASWKRLLYIGLPAAGTRMIFPLTVGVLTRIVASYGSSAVAAYGVATRIEFFALAVLAALSSVIGPFVGQNWGAREFRRARTGVRLSERFCLFWGIGLCLLLQAAARPLAAVFNPDPEVIHGIVLYLRIVPWMFGFQGILLVLANVLNVLERPLQAAAMIFAQMFVFCIPLAYLGSSLWGVWGVFAAVAVAYGLGGVAAHLLARRALKPPLPTPATP